MYDVLFDKILQFMGIAVLFSTLEINIGVFVIHGNEMLRDNFCKKRLLKTVELSKHLKLMALVL